MAAIIEPEERVNCVHIEGLAALKIVKHCQESLPTMVTGSLLGLTVGNGVLEITHAFPFPDPRDSESKTDIKSENDPDDETAMDGHEFQLEMMKMLREVNVDNNCVGWYQSMYLGSYSTSALVDNQLSYQTDLSANAVVILYDPMQTARGNIVMKCLRLTDECVKMKASGRNDFLDPKNIFEELPIKMTNPTLVKTLLYDVADGRHGAYHGDLDCTFDRLDLSTNPFLEKHLEFLCSWVDDLAAEQHKFQFYTRNLSRGDKGRGYDKRKGKEDNDGKPNDDNWESNDAPKRMESLLIANQIRSYCDQVDRFTGAGFGKLFLAGGLHKEQKTL